MVTVNLYGSVKTEMKDENGELISNEEDVSFLVKKTDDSGAILEASAFLVSSGMFEMSTVLNDEKITIKLAIPEVLKVMKFLEN
jgi:hypothetical protein